MSPSAVSNMKYSHKHRRPGGADHRSFPGSASTRTSTNQPQNPVFQQPASKHGKLLAQSSSVRTKGSFGLAKLQRQATSLIEASVGGGLQDLLSYLEERIELAFYERCGTFQLREYARTLPGHRRICEGLIDERVKVSKIVSYSLGLLLRL